MIKRILYTIVFSTASISLHAQTRQRALSRVDQMAPLPAPLQIIDYKALAHKFDKTVYDFNAKGRYWPLVWMDSTRKNFDQPVMGMYTAIGDVRQGPQHNKGMFHEALANMGAVLGATLTGIDKSKQNGRNYVAMLKNYFNRETGWNIMMNNTCPEVALLGGGYGRDWWYDVYPNVLFYAIYDRYPNEPGFREIAHTIAEQFYKADSILNGNYNWSFFDYGKMQPQKNNICAQPDAAAGHAWVLYAAYKHFGDERYLKGALSALKALEAQTINPTYELLMPFGAYLAARINAEQGQNFDVHKLLGWSFDGTAVCREGWGVLVGKWNGIDISGTVGSTVDRGGYGFLMNTYDMAWPMIPLVRYDKQYANAIGKWMLHAANAARFFYPQYMPKEHQALPQLASVTKGVIAYEGIIKQSTYEQSKHLKAPIAQGDGPLWVANENPQESQFSVYGSGHVGIFGSIIRNTNVAGILQLDLLATDDFHDKAYPTYLYYNPYETAKTITLSIPAGKKTDLYNTITGKFTARNASGTVKLTIPPRSSAIMVHTPAGGKMTREGSKVFINGLAVDYK
jgi:hypothetical protein